MNIFITIFQIIVTLLLIGAILLQSQGTGLGKAWGGGSGFYASKRGVEKLVLGLTVILVFLFFVSSVLNFIY